MSDMIHPLKKVSQRADGSIRVQTINNEPTLTQQHFADDCDISKIMDKYAKTGQVTHLNRAQGVYADLSMISDYRGMLETVQHANDVFSTLPALVRDKFRNDPSELITFLQDPNNHDEGVKLGLINPKPIPEQKFNDDLNDDKKPISKKTKTVEPKENNQTS